MDQAPNYVAKFLDSNQFKFKKIHLIKPRVPIQIAHDLTIEMLEGDPRNAMSAVIDSSIIITWDDKVIFNANDNQPHPEAIEYLLKKYAKIDLALLPYGGGSGYPACYRNLTHDDKINEKNRIINSRLTLFLETVQALSPIAVIPFADQYAVAGRFSHLNQYLAHLVCSGDVENAFLTNIKSNVKLILLNSSQSYNFEKDQKFPDEVYEYYTEDNKNDFIIQNLKEIKYDFDNIKINRSVAFDRLIQFARDRLWAAQNKDQYFKNFNIYLEIQDLQRTFEINLNSEKIKECYSKQFIKPYLVLSGTASLMLMLILGQISWNIADAALFIEYERNPNEYDPDIYKYINFIKV
jgi:UDP-MurNAc hydroxylase